MNNDKVVEKIIFILNTNYSITIEKDKIVPFLGYSFIDGTFNQIYRLVSLPDICWIYRQKGEKESLYSLDMETNTLQHYEV